MKTRTKSTLLQTIIAFALLAGVFTPVAVLAQAGATAQSQSQLNTLIGAAQASKAYSHSLVDYASSHSLAVASAQASLGEGDSLLATAQADAQSGSDVAAGIQSVQAAMRDYTYASATASIALSNAGLTASVDYAAAAGAIAEVNATASVVASVAAQACTQAGTNAAGSSAFAQACAQVSAQIASARVRLNQAASLLVQVQGGTQTTVSVSQVLSLVATARTEVDASESALVTIASSTYTQRGQAYFTSVIIPLEANANATLKVEQTVLANLTQLQTETSTYAKSEAGATASVGSSASALSVAIVQVQSTNAAAKTSVASATSTASQVSADLSSLGSVQGLPVGVVADISAGITSANSYHQSLDNSAALVASLNGTQLSQFAEFATHLSSNASAVQTSGSTYLAGYNKVVADLSGLLGVVGVQAVYNELTALQVSSTVTGVNASLSQDSTASAAVQSDISALAASISSSSSIILQASTFVGITTGASAKLEALLNSTASDAVAQATNSVSATAQAAETFMGSATAATSATIATFASAYTTTSNARTSLDAQAQASATAAATAAAFVSSDTAIRAAEIASGHASVSQALQLFSSEDVSGGATAMAQASLELQAASEASA